ncbi:PREDICTED: uncharacterized protein LOC109243132 [Nicotiana attenuata]|uniref:NHL domain-containing protein n=1 Tax=Nicotiana attenuata TaxID=49451 RepID=A0A314L1Z3_NICAT|nr:PREDICTED: uncharacterized protein LOC109243132 [Nicotiana attenuata]OIT35630.1 hypothetical protein A4A49_33572 [Nicotiana attenuata]
MRRNFIILSLIVFLLLLEFSSASASATPAAKIVGGVVTNVASVLFKWLWSLKSPAKTAVSSRSMVKFESGYIVETVFDGSKLGIEPYSVQVSSTGEVLILDSENSNIYRVSTPLSRYSRPKLVAGSPEGYSGHVDGRLREARMDHPKGLAMDDQGNIYVADTINMAIRKISDAGVVTIAGGKSVRGGGHIDGPSEDAKFSDDFDVVYVGSSCSLLVIDRGNRAIREIQLNDDDCSHNQFDDNNLHLGVALLCAAGFFGYMLALLQRRIGALFSSNSNDQRTPVRGVQHATYQRNTKSVRPPLIPPDDEYDKPEENLFLSLGRLVLNTGSTVGEIFGGMFSGFRKKHYPHHVQQHYHYPHKQSSAWPMQESYVIRDEDEAPSLDTRDPTPRKTYPLMNKDPEKARHMRQSQSHYGGWNGNAHGHGNFQQHQQQFLPQVYQHHEKHQSSSPQTYYEQSCESNEIVFGAVQEQDGRRETMVIKAVDYGDPAYNIHNIRSRYNYNTGYSFGY